MKVKLLTGLILVAGFIMIGCDPDRGTTPVAKTVEPKKQPDSVEPATKKDPEIAKYDGFEVTFPESFDGDFNPNGLEVGPEIDQLAPEIEGVDLDGNEFKLSDYRGKVVMLDFYGDW